MKKHNKKRFLLIELAVILAIVAVLAVVIAVDTLTNKATVTIDADAATQILDDTFENLADPLAKVSIAQIEGSDIKVESVKKGTAKETVVTVSYSTKDLFSVYNENKSALFSKTYDYYNGLKESGEMTSATKIRKFMEEETLGLLPGAADLSGKYEISIYEIDEATARNDTFALPYQNAYVRVHLDEQMIDTVFGGVLKVSRDAKNTESFVKDGKTIYITSQNTLKNGLSACFALRNFDSSRPDTSSFFASKWNSFSDEFYRNFIKDAKWQYLAKGLVTTLEITLLAALFGIILGFLCAIVRVSYAKTGKLRLLDQLVSIYLSIIRGTPVMIQLMIIYFVLLLPIGIEKFPAAVICFTINSGAYVAEIVRGGIMSVDNGQMEAGRSLGLNYIQTMYYVIVPQAFKAVLPSLANEFITLLKESSVAFYIGVADLTQGGLKIRSITYSDFMPLVAVAVIYLILVLILTKCVGILERRLQKDER